MSITKEWATKYCQRLINDNNLSFPFTIGRKKQGGYVDSSANIKDENDFYTAYNEFNEHPRCVGILLYHSNTGKYPLSI